MKVCIVLPEYLPVPAVKGGAVETLTEEILKQNEIHKKLDITCVTKYDKEAEKLFEKFPTTTFVTLKFFDDKIDFILRGLNFIFIKITNIDIRKSIRQKRYNKKLFALDCDLFIFEGANNYINEELVKKIGKDKLVLHLHRVYNPNLEREKFYENFISLSEYATNQFCKDNIISKDRVQTLLNGVNLEKFYKKATDTDIEALKERHNIKEKEIVLLYAGRLLPEKGVKELILAFKKMKNKNNCKLLIIGSAFSGNNEETKYVKEIKELSKKENIIFTGYVKNSELYKYYQLANLAVFPSTGQEGLGLVVIEAMCSNLPTIITNSGGMPELVSDETTKIVELDSNLINNLASQMELLTLNEEMRLKMGKKAFEKAKNYTSENYYLGYVKCLENIMENIQKNV